MKCLRLLLGLSSLALASAASAQAGGAIDCIYKGVPASDLVLFMADDADSKARLKSSGAEDRMRARSQGCLRDHRWTPEQGEAALTYAFARVNEDQGVASLAQWGLPPVFVEDVMAELGPVKVAAMVDSKPGAPDDDEMGMVMLKHMTAHHYSGAQDEAALTRIGTALGQAIAGRELANRAAAGFSAPSPAVR